MRVYYHRKRLSKEQQIKIVTKYNAGINAQLLAKQYGVSDTTIYNILKRQAK